MKVLSLSTPDALSSGLRSIMAPLQKRPTLSVVNDETTSGPLPPRMPCRILASATVGTALTVMLGWSLLEARLLSAMALTSLGWLQPCQKVIVTFSSGAETAAVGVVDGVAPVQAASTAEAPAMTATVMTRIGVVLRMILISSGARRPGWG